MASRRDDTLAALLKLGLTADEAESEIDYREAEAERIIEEEGENNRAAAVKKARAHLFALEPLYIRPRLRPSTQSAPSTATVRPPSPAGRAEAAASTARTASAATPTSAADNPIDTPKKLDPLLATVSAKSAPLTPTPTAAAAKTEASVSSPGIVSPTIAEAVTPVVTTTPSPEPPSAVAPEVTSAPVATEPTAKSDVSTVTQPGPAAPDVTIVEEPAPAETPVATAALLEATSVEPGAAVAAPTPSGINGASVPAATIVEEDTSEAQTVVAGSAPNEQPLQPPLDAALARDAETLAALQSPPEPASTPSQAGSAPELQIATETKLPEVPTATQEPDVSSAPGDKPPRLSRKARRAQQNLEAAQARAALPPRAPGSSRLTRPFRNYGRWTTAGPRWHRLAGFGTPFIAIVLVIAAAAYAVIASSDSASATKGGGTASASQAAGTYSPAFLSYVQSMQATIGAYSTDLTAITRLADPQTPRGPSWMDQMIAVAQDMKEQGTRLRQIGVPLCVANSHAALMVGVGNMTNAADNLIVGLQTSDIQKVNNYTTLVAAGTPQVNNAAATIKDTKC